MYSYRIPQDRRWHFIISVPRLEWAGSISARILFSSRIGSWFIHHILIDVALVALESTPGRLCVMIVFISSFENGISHGGLREDLALNGSLNM